MTYGELKRRVLQLIFSSTIAGDEIALSYNNQEDYVKMIPGLLNSAQTYIYQVKRIQDSIKLIDLVKDEPEDEGNVDYDIYLFPDDCLRMKPGLIKPGRGYSRGLFERFNDYRIFGGDKLMVPKGAAERFHLIMEYEKRGVPVPENVKDTFVLQNTDEVNEIIPYYIAAFVVMYDDPFRYSAFYNEFETRLQRLAPNPEYVENNLTVDVYGGFNTGSGGWW